ncbi:uncharacterized protein PRCAT00003299001 [Priceomyces carsonii]|uniref:uncharacterized protein n=1 Tax=Priceomyces carsonii TaxID=28549 RepID=UPI002ED96801|nr:unnamed protein product [Priceomyces carsonii]
MSDSTENILHPMDKREIGRQPSKSILKDNTLPLLTSKRRVSFAPEVTLHKFDFIPSSGKRRKTIGFASESDAYEDLETSDSAERGIEVLEDSSEDDDNDDMYADVEEIISGMSVLKGNQNQDHKAGTDEEQTMELTDQLPNLRPYSQSGLDDEVDMEITAAQKPLPLNDVNEANFEVEMDLTNPQNASSKTIVYPSHPKFEDVGSIQKFIKSVEAEDGVIDLEPGLISPDKNDLMEPIEEKEITMDLTQVKGTIIDTGLCNDIKVSEEIGNKENIRTESSDDYSALQKLEIKSVSSNTNYCREQIRDQDSLFEAPEVVHSEVSLPLMDVTNRTQTKPLNLNLKLSARTSTEHKKSDKIETENIDNKEDIVDEDSNYEPVKLNDFMSDIGIKFYDDLDIDIGTMSRLSISADQKTSFELSDYTVALPRLHLLSLYEFSCEELSKNVDEGKKVFSEFNKTIEVNNPQLFKEYYSSDESGRFSINMKLHLLKDYTRLQSKKTWYYWRTQLTKNLISDLNIKQNDLLNDRNMLLSNLSSIDQMYDRTCSLTESLSLKLKHLLHLGDQLSILSVQEIVNLKNQLVINKRNLHEIEHELTSKVDELGAISDRIEEVNKEKLKLNEELINHEETLRHNRKYETEEIELLQMKFKLLQKLTNMQYNLQEGSTLYLLFDSVVDIQLSFDKEEGKTLFKYKLNNQTLSRSNIFYKSLIGTCFEQLNNQDYTQFKSLFVMKELWSKLKQFDEDLHKISFCCPISFSEVKDGRVTFSIKYVNISEDLKAILDGELDLAKLHTYPSNLSLKAKIKRTKEPMEDHHIVSSIVKDFVSNNLVTFQNVSNLSYSVE